MPLRDPEAKKAYEQEYRSRPEVRARTKEYLEKYHKEYIHKPGVKERRQSVYRIWAKANVVKRRLQAAEYRLNRRAFALVAMSKKRAKGKKLAFDLDDHILSIQRRVDAGVCEITGYPFDLTPGRKFNGPSIDRIDPSRGYTYDNIRVVLNLVNLALNSWGEDALREVMTHWLMK